jgi:hypothetical protein
MVEPLRHRQTKGAETDMPGLPPPRHIPTLPGAVSPRHLHPPWRHFESSPRLPSGRNKAKHRSLCMPATAYLCLLGLFTCTETRVRPSRFGSLNSSLPERGRIERFECLDDLQHVFDLGWITVSGASGGPHPYPRAPMNTAPIKKGGRMAAGRAPVWIGRVTLSTVDHGPPPEARARGFNKSHGM